jgi:hypothetical protein
MRAQFGAQIIEETRTNANPKGLYRADVMIRGKMKEKGSWFFPRHWTRTQVLQAIREAYATRGTCWNGRNWFMGWSETFGVRIKLCVNDEGFICTAFPMKGSMPTPEKRAKRSLRRARRTARRWWGFVMLMLWMHQNNYVAAVVQIERPPKQTTSSAYNYLPTLVDNNAIALGQ